VLKIMLVFSMVSVFWALFDQHASTWVQQAGQMNLKVPLLRELAAEQSQMLNPFLVMALIPCLNFGVYKPLARRGIVIKPLQRMTAGMFITALSFVAAAYLQGKIEGAAPAPGSEKLHVAWQSIQYVLLTLGEVLVSVTGLEFAYTQAPRAMKSTMMGFWFLCVTVGDLLVAFLAPLQQRLSLADFFWTFAALMAAAAVVFTVLACFYKGKTYLQEGSA
jgi:POT family proton-dependent oligopeptide transporter